MHSDSLDKVIIKDLLLRGIVGINPDERVKKQDILVNLVLWADMRQAAASDDIAHAVNYKTVSKAVIEHVEGGDPQLVERLAAEVAEICFRVDGRVQAVEVTIEKPGALRFARSVGVSIYRTRAQMNDDA
ncbi:MAG: dihydroneopterin aldolase [Caldilineales bacterium]|nr:dihydroneopterin aldolase [Caldilineales bacterium]